MPYSLFAVAEAQSSGIGALGISPSAFIIQLISFVIVFTLLRRYAFKPIGKLLEERRKTIEDGVFLGQQMEDKMAKLKQETALIVKEARIEADHIIATAQKDAREVIRDAEKVGQRKVDMMVADAQARNKEEAQAAKRRLEKEIVGLVSEATEAIVVEKVDSQKDSELIDRAMKEQK